MPDQSPTQKRSIAERDRLIILGSAIVLLLPIFLALTPFVESGLTRLLATFIVGMAIATGIAFFLRHRFIGAFTASDLAVRPTTRSLSSLAQRNSDELTGNGFALVDVVTISNGADEVFTRPLGLFQRVSDEQVAACGELGVQLISRLSEEALVITASHDVVAHESILAHVDSTADLAEIIVAHDQGLERLRNEFGVVPMSTTPAEALLAIELCEQETLRNAEGLGTLNRSLIAPAGSPEDDAVHRWLVEHSLLPAKR